MMKIIILIVVILGLSVLLVIYNESDPELPSASSKFLDPNGIVTLYVSNQSFAVDPVDIRVEIDNELVVSEYFRVETQHSFEPFKLSLPQGKHIIHVWSIKGQADMQTEFEMLDNDVAVITYWYNPKSKNNSYPRHFGFKIQKSPLIIM
jgi:hypothetical protein